MRRTHWASVLRIAVVFATVGCGRPVLIRLDTATPDDQPPPVPREPYQTVSVVVEAGPEPTEGEGCIALSLFPQGGGGLSASEIEHAVRAAIGASNAAGGQCFFLRLVNEPVAFAFDEEAYWADLPENENAIVLAQTPEQWPPFFFFDDVLATQVIYCISSNIAVDFDIAINGFSFEWTAAMLAAEIERKLRWAVEGWTFDTGDEPIACE